MKKVLAVVAIALTGCATSESIDRAVSARVVGKPIDAAIKHYGYPDQEMTIAGRKLYIWNNSRTAPGALVPNGTGGLMALPSNTYGCTMRLEVDKDNVVRDFRVSGQMGACADFES